MTALILVDLQNDFMPGGALAVKDGDTVLPTVRSLLKKPFDHVIASVDWHPKHHCSFASTHGKNVGDVVLIDEIPQILWPDHCIQGTEGAKLHEGFPKDRIEKLIQKGSFKNVDSYSAFFDNESKHGTGLKEYLEENGIKEIYIAGLATDYCVKYSVLDALKLGLKTYVIIDACKGVDLHFEDSKKAIDLMKKAGAHIIREEELKI